jgi:hypothetical protein
MFQDLLWAWGPWIYNKISSGVVKVKKVAQVVYNEFNVKKEWIFFKNVAVPVNSENFWKIDDSSVKWKCEVFPARFIDPSADPNIKSKHLSYLGFVIKIEGRDIDLSDWINDVRYTGNEEPSVGEIFALWCCETGESYFHCLDSIQVEYITELGDVVRKRA